MAAPRCAAPPVPASEFCIFFAFVEPVQVKEHLLPDALAGITVGIMAVPQGMSYGLVSGTGPKYGLYTSFYPMLICASPMPARPLPSMTDAL